MPRSSLSILGLVFAVAVGPSRAVLAQTSEPAALPQQPATLPQPPAALPLDEVKRLRAELEALGQEYARKIASIEARLSALEGARAEAGAPAPQGLEPSSAAVPEPSPPPAPPALAQVVPPGAAGAQGPSGTLPVYGNVAALSKVFNPDIAAIGDFIGAAGKRRGGEPSLDMHESELAFQAVVDPYARADFFVTLGPDGAGVEEGFITFPTAPGELLLRVGKMRDAFGKVNAMHNHVLPWVDRPLVTKNLLGGEDGLADAGVSVSRLIPNPWLFLEATGQVYRGETEVFKAPSRSDLAYVGHLRAYQDVSESTNLDLGGSFAWGTNDAGPGFKTRLLGADATFRYRPLRRAIYRRFIGRAELVWSRRERLTGVARAFGAYVSAEYQFARRWFAGARWDHSDRPTEPALTDKGGSFLLTYWPSEFSQVRAQYRHTRFGEGRTADELLFQFLFSIGAHGAHPF